MAKERRWGALGVMGVMSQQGPVPLIGTVLVEKKNQPNPKSDKAGMNTCDMAKIAALARNELNRNDREIGESILSVTDEELIWRQ